MTPHSSNESDSDKQIVESEFKKLQQSSKDEEIQQSTLKTSSDTKQDLELLDLPGSKKEEQVSQSNSDSAEATLQVQEPSVIPLMERTRTLPVNMEAQGGGVVEDSGRERLKRHRVEVAGRVWIPDMWGQEDLLKDWIDCSAFDASLMNSNIMLARAALVQEGRRANSTRIGIENSC